MEYISTRNQVPAVPFSLAVEQGLAPDGGLYIPKELPDLRPYLVAWSDLSYPDLCKAFFNLFATNFCITRKECHRLIRSFKKKSSGHKVLCLKIENDPKNRKSKKS